jgi:hypothetical protein
MNKQPEQRLPNGRRQTKFDLNSLQISFAEKKSFARRLYPILSSPMSVMIFRSSRYAPHGLALPLGNRRERQDSKPAAS